MSAGLNTRNRPSDWGPCIINFSAEERERERETAVENQLQDGTQTQTHTDTQTHRHTDTHRMADELSMLKDRRQRPPVLKAGQGRKSSGSDGAAANKPKAQQIAGASTASDSAKRQLPIREPQPDGGFKDKCLCLCL